MRKFFRDKPKLKEKIAIKQWKQNLNK
jgi:hypothetical protein